MNCDIGVLFAELRNHETDADRQSNFILPMKSKPLLPALAVFSIVMSVQAQLLITGIVDGPLAGGTPKAIELYAVEDIPDLSIYNVETPNNGGEAKGGEFALSGKAEAGEYLVISYETTQFMEVFGVSPHFISASARINGDDNVILYKNREVIDQFGVNGEDGTRKNWEYTDGWAYRIDGTGPDPEFKYANWRFSGVRALNKIDPSRLKEAIPFGSYKPAGQPPPVEEPVTMLSANPAAQPHVQPEAPPTKPPEELTLEEVKALAEEGDVQSQARLAYYYDTGQGGEKNLAKAIEWYQVAATNGDVYSQWALAMKYLKGEGVPMDARKASPLLESLAELNYTDAQYQLGKLLTDEDQAPSDPEEGIDWLRKAAEHGHPESQYRLAQLLLTGKQVPRNDEQGISWLRKAAGLGVVDAQRELGFRYNTGSGVPQNVVESYLWFARAAAQNDPQSLEMKNQLERQMTPQQLTEAMKGL